VAAMLTQRNLPGARCRRRCLSDAGLGEIRRRLRYTCPWYGSTLVEADRWFPSSLICSRCAWRNTTVGWDTQWVCQRCRATHDRDDNAVINPARRAAGDLGPVGASGKRGADHKTRTPPAGGDGARTLTPVGEPVGVWARWLRDGARTLTPVGEPQHGAWARWLRDGARTLTPVGEPQHGAWAAA